MPYFVSKYEQALSRCANIWAPHAKTVWRGLNHAKSQDDPKHYELATGLLRSSNYHDAAKNSAVRDLNDKMIEKFESGASQAKLAIESYIACAEWAELDPDQIMNGRPYEPLNEGQLAIIKGLLFCD